MPDFEITVNGVEKLLRNLNTRKAAGPDGIPCRLLQAVHKELAPALTTLFTKSLNSGQVPMDWKHALVQPIYSKREIIVIQPTTAPSPLHVCAVRSWSTL